jgi:hypothetical protein
MRAASLTLIGLATALTAAAQGITATGFSTSDWPCGFKHDPAVESALQNSTVRALGR